MIKKWIFDETVSNIYKTHVRQHIPNYDRVIDKSISVCQKLCNKNDSIIDVGCATGETLQRLHDSGFNNLTGVESSYDMLKQCDYNIAKYIHNDKFPEKTFDAVLCNWTLHFIENKKLYLEHIYRNLSESGFLILSDKTANQNTVLDFYHDTKRTNGVSEEDIIAKAASLNGVMYINSVEWYLDTLKDIGFSQVNVFDADWCFASFFCQK